MFGPKTNQQYICDSTGICDYTAEGSNKPSYSTPKSQNSILSSVGKHIYDNSFAYGLAAAAIGTAVWGPDLSTIYQFGRSLVYDPLPLTPVQQGLLESGEIWEQLPAKLISPLIALNQFIKYNFAHRFDANNKVSNRNYLIHKRKAYSAVQKIRNYIETMKRSRPSKTARRGTYPGTLKSDGQFRYGLGRLGRKALFRMPTFDCSPDDEIKWKDFAFTTTENNGTTQIINIFDTLCAIDRGTSSNTRVGQRTKIHAFDLKVTAPHAHDNNPGTSGPSEHGLERYIVELWYDAQTNGTAASATAVYAANAYESFPNMDNTSRFYPVWSSGELAWNMVHAPDVGVSDDRVFVMGPGIQVFIPVPSTCIEYTASSDMSTTVSSIVSSNYFLVVKYQVEPSKYTLFRTQFDVRTYFTDS